MIADRSVCMLEAMTRRLLAVALVLGLALVAGACTNGESADAPRLRFRLRKARAQYAHPCLGLCELGLGDVDRDLGLVRVELREHVALPDLGAGLGAHVGDPSVARRADPDQAALDVDLAARHRHVCRHGRGLVVALAVRARGHGQRE